MNNIFETHFPLPGRGSPGPPPEPGLGAGPGSERLVTGPIPMGPSRIQPEETTWVPFPTWVPFSPPVGGAKGVGCNVSWVAAEGRGLGGLIVGY